MKITSISSQIKDSNRVNILIDGKYRFSLDLYQLVELGIKVGQEIDEPEIENLQNESLFGKVYSRALEYCLIRPRSNREVRDYLFKKTISRRDKNGEKKPGLSEDSSHRIIKRLTDKGYIDDLKFAKYWVENRYVKKGISFKKLIFELRKKGIDSSLIDVVMNESNRDDESELAKIIQKKAARYPDKRKFAQYLARQGFSYDDIKTALDM